MNVAINSSVTYGIIQQNFNFTIPDGYTVLVGKNDSGKSSLLQLMFKTIHETGTMAKDRFCLLLPERIFIEPTLEVGGNTLPTYNQQLFNNLQYNPLPYHGQTHNSQSAFKLLISNHRQRLQLNTSDLLLEKLGFSRLDITQGNQVIIDNINIGKHGSGLRTILPIIAVLTEPNIEYVLIDEPEQSLEPAIQKYVREMLYEYSQHKKIVVTTHSHLFLNRRTPQSNYIVSRTTSGIDLTQVQPDIEMYDLVYKLLGSSPDDLFFPRNFMVVEGASDQTIVEKIIALMGKSSFDVKVISARSVLNVEDYRKAFEACLTPYVLKDSYYKDKVVVLVDKPNDQLKPTVDELRRNLHERLFELPEESLEEFLPEELYSRCGRDKQVEIQKIKAAADYETLKRLKTAISRDIADHLTQTDLPTLAAITKAINKAVI